MIYSVNKSNKILLHRVRGEVMIWMDFSNTVNNLHTLTICHICPLWGTLIKPVDIEVNNVVFSQEEFGKQISNRASGTRFVSGDAVGYIPFIYETGFP